MSEPVLLLDVGNSRIKWALEESGSIVAGGSLQHVGLSETGDLAQISLSESPTRVLVSNVAGEKFASQIAKWVSQQFSCEAEFIVSEFQNHGIINAYAEPSKLGSDRWLAMIAARQHVAGYLCVVDAGSALTLDFLGPGGQHLGGYILPGLQSGIDCVVNSTHLQGKFEAGEPESRQPGTTTAGCLINGAILSACLAIEGSISELENNKRQKVQCILTGGDSNRLSGELKIPHIIEPALVLKGLATISRNTDSMK